MNPLAAYLVLILLSPLIIFAVQIVTVRVINSLRLTVQPLATGVLAVAISFIVLAPVAWALFLGTVPDYSSRWIAVLYGILTYAGLAFCYFQVFAMTETARRLHILHELYTKKDMTFAQLEADYGASKMLATRIHRMVEIGQLNCNGSRYTLRSGLLLWVGQIMSFWAKVLGFEK